MTSMPTLRRILKYTPAVVFGLLVVAWVASGFGWAAYLATLNQRNFVTAVGRGAVELRTYIDTNPATTARGLGYGIHIEEFGPWYSNLLVGGFSYYQVPDGQDDYTAISFPLPIILSLLLPLAMGPFLSFRFRLWHHLAYTSLIAAELAHYLRWQE